MQTRMSSTTGCFTWTHVQEVFWLSMTVKFMCERGQTCSTTDASTGHRACINALFGGLNLVDFRGSHRTVRTCLINTKAGAIGRNYQQMPQQPSNTDGNALVRRRAALTRTVFPSSSAHRQRLITTSDWARYDGNSSTRQ